MSFVSRVIVSAWVRRGPRLANDDLGPPAVRSSYSELSSFNSLRMAACSCPCAVLHGPC
jgi:hypothetical protein